jgi:hypothetical protein
LRLEPATIATPSAAAVRTIATFTTFWPGTRSGAADELLQLREGDERSANEIDPISAEKRDRERLVPRKHAVELVVLGECDQRAAPPPTPLNRATICGIAVIFTRRAPITPDDAPDRALRRRSAPSSRCRR